MTDTTEKLQRWHVQLSEPDLEVLNRTGVKHKAANSLSHLFRIGINEYSLEDDVLVSTKKKVPPEGEETAINAKVSA